MRSRCKVCKKNQTNTLCEKCDVQLCFTKERNCFRSFYTHWHFKFHVLGGRCMYTLCQWDSDDSGIQLGDAESHGHVLRTERMHDAAPAEHDGRMEMCKKRAWTLCWNQRCGVRYSAAALTIGQLVWCRWGEPDLKTALPPPIT